MVSDVDNKKKIQMFVENMTYFISWSEKMYTVKPVLSSHPWEA